MLKNPFFACIQEKTHLVALATILAKNAPRYEKMNAISKKFRKFWIS
jgi:hypothetical protein